MKIKRTLAVRIAAVLFLAACGGSGTGVDNGSLAGSFALVQVDGTSLPIATRGIVGVSPTGETTPSCTESLTAMSIDVTSSGDATRSESRQLTCDDGSPDATIAVIESGTASKTGDQWRFDFTQTEVGAATHYFGRLGGTTLTIVRRETDATSVGQVSIPATVSLSQLVFQRL